MNIFTYKLIEIKHPFSYENGFEFSENFDGLIKIGKYTFLFNLKMICDSGGAQTRSLREVHNFIHSQLEYCLENENTKYFFINILDGDESNYKMKYITHLLNKKRYKKNNFNIYCGDMYDFFIWKIKNQLYFSTK